MTTFRCHYADCSTLDVSAERPEDARTAAQAIRKGIIAKVKVVRAAA